MVRAKDVDLARLKRKAATSDTNMLMMNASEDERAALTTAKSSLSKPKNGIIARSVAGALKGPNHLRSMAKLGAKNHDQSSLDEDMEKPVYKLVRSIDEKKTISVKKSPHDIKRLLDEEDRRKQDQSRDNSVKHPRAIKA
jgi:hypothetical protein